MSQTSGLTRVILRLGRNPEQGFPEGDDHHGYVLHAPLNADGYLDADLWATHKEACTVRRFQAAETAADGWLRKRGDSWYFWYDEVDEGPAEAGVKLGAHRFRVDEYVTIREGAGEPLAFRVADVQYLP
jgi:hypothetical protein